MSKGQRFSILKSQFQMSDESETSFVWVNLIKTAISAGNAFKLGSCIEKLIK